MCLKKDQLSWTDLRYRDSTWVCWLAGERFHSCQTHFIQQRNLLPFLLCLSFLPVSHLSACFLSWRVFITFILEALGNTEKIVLYGCKSCRCAFSGFVLADSFSRAVCLWGVKHIPCRMGGCVCLLPISVAFAHVAAFLVLIGNRLGCTAPSF